MIKSRALSQLQKCNTCRYTVLNSFLYTTGHSIRPNKSFLKELGNPRHQCQSRNFTQHSPRFTNHLSEDHGENASNSMDNNASETENLVTPEDSGSSGSNVPWYLQVEIPIEDQSSLLERQKLPDLPPDPPPLLQPILEHMLYTLGLDDLVVLDLRKVDPPPPLGANLLMVICTARSEKHLHVSADSFRKWMRTANKTSVLADGLIGRGELKLKLRRKARRARIMSRVGSIETSSTDDDTRTGWVCITANDIEDGVTPDNSPESFEGYVGFGGSAADGVKLVVQMLTRERRQELDLEELWGKVIWRNGRREAKIIKALEAAASQSTIEASPAENGQPPTSLSTHPQFSNPHKVSMNQARCMHSYISHQSREITNPSSTSQLNSETPYTSSMGDNSQEAAMDPNLEGALAAISREHERNLNEVGAGDADLIRLRDHIDYIKSIPHESLPGVLGNKPEDTDSTPFIRSFHKSLPLFLDKEHWDCYIELLCYAIQVGVPGWHKEHLVRKFGEMRASSIDINTDTYLQAVQTLFTPSDISWKQGESVLPSSSLLDGAALLEDMSFRGHNIATDEIRVLLEISVARATAVGEQRGIDPALLPKFRQLLNKGSRELPVGLEILKLHAYADAELWDEVWNIWCEFPARFRPRPKELYVAMLQRIAGRGHQAKILNALRVIVQEMEAEEPIVPLDVEIADAIKDCLRAIDSDIDNLAAEDWDSNDELFKLWRRCEQVKQEENRFLREYDDD